MSQPNSEGICFRAGGVEFDVVEDGIRVRVEDRVRVVPFTQWERVVSMLGHDDRIGDKRSPKVVVLREPEAVTQSS